MVTVNNPDLIITNAKVYTGDSENKWAEAFAVTDGTLNAVGSSAEIEAFAGPATVVEDLHGAFIMPALNDVHVHLGLGGTMITWELQILPTDSVQAICSKVSDWVLTLNPNQWIVGGVVGSSILEATQFDVGALRALDEASAGHPVILRDETMHNRWVNSAALEAMGITADTTDLEGSRYVRDEQGRLTGWLFEAAASAQAEATFQASITDPASRDRTSIRNAVSALNAAGIVSVQDAGTMGYVFPALQALDEAGELGIRVVTSTPVAPFVEPGPTGVELADLAQTYRSPRIRPDFVKFFVDGVPTTRTTSLLEPYICHNHNDEPEYGELYWTLDDLVAELRSVAERGLGAKLHTSGDGSVRRALDAIEQLRPEFPDAIFQLAHASLISDVDRPRFTELNVVADSSPHFWFPNEISPAIAHEIPEESLANIYPHRTLLGLDVLVAAGSDWPVGAATPSPWRGFESIITRRNPDPAFPGTVCPDEALDLEQAIYVFTAAPAEAMGLGNVTGRLKRGLSADFIVLDRDLFTIPVTEIHETLVRSTWLEGRAVRRHQMSGGK